jgi:EAL domain-containing protein (putative c-di-GMP-specific phosphodiesterase class I)
MLREACRTLRRWEDEVGADWVQIGVNLSQRHLQQPELVGTVRAALEDHDLDPDRLILEITESAVMENGGGTIETLRALKALGVRLAIDDFGTGYSSLAHLHRFPIDVLKIDRSFTAALGGEGGGASIAGAIVSLSRALGLTTVAEGIENEAQKREVRRLGSAFGQGFLFARPQPPEAFDTLLRGGRPAAGGRVLLAR